MQKSGGPTRARTWDRPVMSRWLYQLSYRSSRVDRRVISILRDPRCQCATAAIRKKCGEIALSAGAGRPKTEALSAQNSGCPRAHWERKTAADGGPTSAGRSRVRRGLAGAAYTAMLLAPKIPRPQGAGCARRDTAARRGEDPASAGGWPRAGRSSGQSKGGFPPHNDEPCTRHASHGT